MRPLAVNFVSRRTIWPWVGYALSVVMVSVAAHQAWSALTLRAQVRSGEEEVLRLNAEMDDKRLSLNSASKPNEEPAYARDAAALNRLASFDAGKVLAALESAQVVGVKVTAVEILPEDRAARVDLEVADPAALLRYLEQLNAGIEPSQGWQLVRAQSPTPTNAGSATILARAGVGAR